MHKDLFINLWLVYLKNDNVQAGKKKPNTWSTRWNVHMQYACRMFAVSSTACHLIWACLCRSSCLHFCVCLTRHWAELHLHKNIYSYTCTKASDDMFLLISWPEESPVPILFWACSVLRTATWFNVIANALDVLGVRVSVSAELGSLKIKKEPVISGPVPDLSQINFLCKQSVRGMRFLVWWSLAGAENWITGHNSASDVCTLCVEMLDTT